MKANHYHHGSDQDLSEGEGRANGNLTRTPRFEVVQTLLRLPFQGIATRSGCIKKMPPKSRNALERQWRLRMSCFQSRSSGLSQIKVKKGNLKIARAVRQEIQAGAWRWNQGNPSKSKQIQVEWSEKAAATDQRPAAQVLGTFSGACLPLVNQGFLRNEIPWWVQSNLHEQRWNQGNPSKSKQIQVNPGCDKRLWVNDFQPRSDRAIFGPQQLAESWHPSGWSSLITTNTRIHE